MLSLEVPENGKKKKKEIKLFIRKCTELQFIMAGKPQLVTQLGMFKAI